MKKIWEKFYDWVLLGAGSLLTIFLGWLIVSSVMAISINVEKAFRTPDSASTKVQFDFQGLESLGLTANTPSVTATTTTSTEGAVPAAETAE
ncbi:MAG: hypothetical protein KGZ30_03120 [Anaplasmataceae bacterium]|nr:hypothetical protein [Anaplasmataceae bacterium]